MEGARQGRAANRWQPPLIPVTERFGCFNIWFRAERSIAEYFVPRCQDGLLLGLDLLRDSFRVLRIVQEAQHVVTRDPKISMIFKVPRTANNIEGVMVLLTHTYDIKGELSNPLNRPSLPNPIFIKSTIERAKTAGISTEDLNISTVNAALLVQVVARELVVELNDSFPSPYDPQYGVGAWIKECIAKSTSW